MTQATTMEIDFDNLLSPRFFKALSDPRRVAILIRLAKAGGPCNVREIAACCPTDLSVVSRHLATMRDAGILQSEKRGKEVYYHVDHGALAAVFSEIASAFEYCCPPGESGGCCGSK